MRVDRCSAEAELLPEEAFEAAVGKAIVGVEEQKGRDGNNGPRFEREPDSRQRVLPLTCSLGQKDTRHYLDAESHCGRLQMRARVRAWK